MHFELTILASIFLMTYAVAADAGIGRDQSAGVKGVLMCDGKPDDGTLVKLYDDDRGIDTDDLMGSTRTDKRGNFQVSGYTSEITPIDPKFNIYTNCHDKAIPCKRKITIRIPDSYINEGKVPTKIYDAGVIQLAGKFPGESRDCIH